ncbi:MAG: phage protease [Candidatus Polarisedimenticolia bacterium]
MTDNVVYPAKILERADNGAVLAHMLLAVAAGPVDLEATAGGQDSTIDLTPEVLAQLSANFGKTPGPCPVYISHVADEVREFIPAAGWVESTAIEGERGELLVGDVRLGPSAAYEVVDLEGWRSCSIEFALDVETPTGVVEGWSLLGLALTNQPALPVENRFQFAAPAVKAKRLAHASVRFSLKDAEEKEMNEEEAKDAVASAPAVEAEVPDPAAELDARIAELGARLEAQAAEFEGRVAALEAERAELAAKAEGAEIKLAVEKALGEGKLAPAEAEGLEEDPRAWMQKIVGKDGGVAELSADLAARKPVVNLTKAVGAGSAPAASEDPIAWKLVELGIDPTFMNCRTAAEARRALNK